MKKLKTIKFKSGATSFYVIIFATILLSVITVSFIRIMTSNMNNTVNDDLSISAYDSALAGIEDAKIALTKYHNCIDQNSTSGDCAFVTKMQQNIKDGSCDTASVALGRTSATNPQPVVIQETSSAADASDSSNMLQAYTCVKITEDLTDYRGTLTSENRTATIPLRTKDYKDVRSIKIMWHEKSDANPSALGAGLPAYNNNLIPALLVDFYQTTKNFTMSDLSTRKGEGVDHASIFLRPASIENHSSQIVNNIARGDIVSLADKYDNPTTSVTCSKAAFMCTAIINLPYPINSDGSSDTADFSNRIPSTFFLRLSLPYANESGTTYSITMCKTDNCSGNSGLENPDNASGIAYFSGVQARIDSTGRANDVYRRLDVRVELVETGFSYPEYEIWMVGSGADSDINKDFWVTKDCKIKEDSSTPIHDCADTGNA